MERNDTFTHIGTEANNVLMKIAQKSSVHRFQYCQNEPTFSPSSNDNKDTVNSKSPRVVGIPA